MIKPCVIHEEGKVFSSKGPLGPNMNYRWYDTPLGMRDAIVSLLAAALTMIIATNFSTLFYGRFVGLFNTEIAPGIGP